jgi:hypothetical protein
LILVIVAFGNISFVSEIRKTDSPNNFFIEIKPLRKKVTWDYTNVYPIVEIVYPEEGANLPSNYLEVLG